VISRQFSFCISSSSFCAWNFVSFPNWYFFFDGTATRDCDLDQKAEYLVNIDAKDNENITVITREQAVEHAWRKLKAERRSGNQLVIRY
jgi:hypothetical protein